MAEKMIRGILRWLFKLVFFLLLFMTIIFFLIGKISDESTIKPIFSSIIAKEFMADSESAGFISETLEKCRTEQNVPIPFLEEDLMITCSKVINTNYQDFGILVGDAYFDGIYYSYKSCSFMDCVDKILDSGDGPPFLLSKAANEFIKSIFYFLLVLLIVVGIGLFFLIETWEARLFSFGIFFLFAGMPYFTFSPLLNFYNIQMEGFKTVMNTILAEIKPIFLILLIFGLALIISGLVFKFILLKRVSTKILNDQD